MPVNPSQYALAINKNVPNALGTQHLNRQVKKFRGKVTHNYDPKNGNVVFVTPVELIPLSTGHLLDNPLGMKVKYTDATGRTGASRGTHNNNIPCIYYSSDTYRKTPPNVQRGEEVWIWLSGDGRTWYWEPCNKDSLSARRLETVVQGVNADKPTGKDSKQLGSQNMYYTETSSENQTYTVSTSAANGEVTTYLIQINGKKGSMILQDGMGNIIEINSSQGLVWLKNQCGTTVKLDKNNIEMKCNEHYKAEVGQNYSLKVGGDMTIEVGGSVNYKAGGSFNANIGGSTTVDCSQVTFTGNVNINQGLNVSGMSTMGGGGTVQGNMAISGNLSANGPVNFPAGGSIKGYD